jgi:hypothetical protein
MSSDTVEKHVAQIAAYGERTTGRINAALIALLTVSGIHIFASAIYIADRIAFTTLTINALGLVLVSAYFWHLANKPQFLVLSINENSRRNRPANWIRRADTTKYAVYGLLTLCGAFVTYLVVFFSWAVFEEGGSLVMPDFLWLVVIMGLFLLALIISFLLGYQASVDASPIYASVEEPLLYRFVKSGLGIFPKKVALGSSQNIILRFAFSDKCGTHSNPVPAGSCNEYVEAELQAAALKVDGDKKLRLYDTSPLPVSLWNCQFPESGTQIVNLIISEVNSATDTRSVVFTFEHTIKIKGALIASVQPVVAITLSIVTLWASASSVLSGVLHIVV